MPDGSALGVAFESLRERLLDRLMELRPSFDAGLARGSEVEARATLGAMVAHPDQRRDRRR